MGSRWGTGGRSVRKRVDPARVARRYGIRAADDAVRTASGLCPASVRGCPSHEVLALRRTPSQMRDGIRPRQSGRNGAGTALPDDVPGRPIWRESMEGARLGRNGSATREGLHLRPQEHGLIGRGDRERRAAMPRAVRGTLREEKTGSASAVGFAATVAEPFRSGKRVRARITTRQAPFRKERGTPCGCAALRGVDRPRPRP